MKIEIENIYYNAYENYGMFLVNLNDEKGHELKDIAFCPDFQHGFATCSNLSEFVYNEDNKEWEYEPNYGGETMFFKHEDIEPFCDIKYYETDNGDYEFDTATIKRSIRADIVDSVNEYIEEMLNEKVKELSEDKDNNFEYDKEDDIDTLKAKYLLANCDYVVATGVFHPCDNFSTIFSCNYNQFKTKGEAEKFIEKYEEEDTYNQGYVELLDNVDAIEEHLRINRRILSDLNLDLTIE